VSGTFAGTPGRLRLLGAVAIVGCLVFGALAFVAATRLHSDITNTRNNAAQLVRVQTIRTSLVKADANATNAFLVGGLEPAAARAAYDDGVTTAARTLTEAASANSDDADVLQQVNRVFANYTGLIEQARSNNRQGFPVGAAYLRQASNTIQRDALPPLAALVGTEQQRVDSSTQATDVALGLLLVVLVLALIALVVLQVWLYGKTRRVFNPSLLVATAIVGIVGVIGLGVMAWSQAEMDNARDGAYRQTVALATARMNGFDAKSAEALTLINRGSGAPFEQRFQTVSKTATDAIAGGEQTQTIDAFAKYLAAHTEVRKLDDGGDWDKAVTLATGTGAANADFASFESVSGRALANQANKLADALDRARLPLVVLAWLLLLAGIAAAVAGWRGVDQRLREYR
jgi:hypothetical protein